MARFSLLRNRTHLGRQTECDIRSKVATACLIQLTMEPAKKFRTFQLFSELHFARQTQLAAKALQLLGCAARCNEKQMNNTEDTEELSVLPSWQELH